MAAARKRIAWHNGSWADKGYGVWALKSRDGGLASPGRLLGWCGFAAPDLEGHDPEILYGLSRAFWGRGLAREAAETAIAWLFGHTQAPGLSALIFGRLNPGSLKVTGKLGMTLRGTMPFKDFMADEALALEVLDYEIWRLGEGPCDDPAALVFQAPYKAGQVVGAGFAEPAAAEAALCDAARSRGGLANAGPADRGRRVRAAFREGMAESHVDWYHLTRDAWAARFGKEP